MKIRIGFNGSFSGLLYSAGDLLYILFFQFDLLFVLCFHSLNNIILLLREVENKSIYVFHTNYYIYVKMEIVDLDVKRIWKRWPLLKFGLFTPSIHPTNISLQGTKKNIS